MSDIDTAYQRFCKERFVLPREKDVANLERRIGVHLPSDYRRYLLEYNGGIFTEPQIIPQEEGCPTDRLTFMNGLGATHPVVELASERNLGLFDDNYPAQILPIGYTLMGNLILLITRAEDRGCVVMKRAFSSDSYFLADGIEELFSLLREPVDE